jgi:hypothetical protein
VTAINTSADGYYTARGVRCNGSTLTIADSRLNATYETAGGFMNRFGVDASDCRLEIDGSEVRTDESGGTSAALRATATSNPAGPAEIIVRGSRLISTGYGMRLSGDAEVAVFDSDMGGVLYADAATATCTGVSLSTPAGAAFGFTTNGACP